MPETGANTDDTTLLALLRRATAVSHNSLDQKFSQIDLTSRKGYVRFLSAHLAGMASVFGFAREFAKAELGLDLTDFPALLRGDLAELGVPPIDIAVPAPAVIEPAAITYVIAGSRLGVAALAREPFFGKSAGRGAGYMDDKAGLAIWRAHSAWLKNVHPGEAEGQRMAMSAIATFDCFAAALESTAPAQAA
ncbi:MAG: biliverdin-producing heme oxygenase [Novosphingobium sp.]|nr:biliverdin-producing heme oxygenase [Novosphingobium sp.]